MLSNITLKFSDENVVITSPGSLYKITLEEVLNGGQTYRNPNLIKVLDKLGYIENFGRGIERILSAYENEKSKQSFEPYANSFKVILLNLNWILNDGINDGVNDGVNFDSLILKIVKTNPGVRVPQIKQELSSIGYSLNELQIENRIRRNLKGKIKFEGAPKNGGYVIVKQ